MEGAFLEIGAYGWLHDDWQDRFYPDELPEDWQLSYYANEFRFVVIPASSWIQADEEEVEQWLDDVHDQFNFFIELDHASLKSESSRLEQLQEILADRIHGFIYRDTASNLEKDLSGLSQLANSLPVHVDVPGSDSLEIIRKNGLLPCWRQSEAQSGKDFVVGFVPRADALSNQRELRDVLQSFLSSVDENGEFFLVFEGDPPHIKAMQDAVVIAELLGV